MIRKTRRSSILIILFFLILSLIWILLNRMESWSFRETFDQLTLMPTSTKEVQLSDGSTENDWNFMEHAPSYLSIQDIHSYVQNKKKMKLINSNATVQDTSKCTMEKCFNFTRCQNGFKVHAYKADPLVPTSSTYDKILNIITSSPYYTTNPQEACLFVLSIDTLDRDDLSRNFVRNVPSRLKKLPMWNNGENHIVFNLYAGTWPNYHETELGFDVGKGILAKASMSVDHFRPNYDISIPLFHGTHSERGDEPGLGVSNEFPSYKKHLISFKGKRYVYGIGSETRNSVHHLHNADGVIMLTTCKHGKNWKELKDDRCDQDNAEYEKYDYETLLLNSTFCLVPRGRRLGSFRFLEALKAGCIPVLVSNGWILPFSEVIDWKKATIMGDERALLQILDLVRSEDPIRIFSLKQQTQVIWNQYLSSMQRIIWTTLEIIKDRIRGHSWRSSELWNTVPGALSLDLEYADDLSMFPFYHDAIPHPNNSYPNTSNVMSKFTAVIYVDSEFIGSKYPITTNYANAPLIRLIKSAVKSKYISKILIVWNSSRPIPKSIPDVGVPIIFKRNPSKSFSQRFVTRDEIETDAVLTLNENDALSTDAMDFAFQVWKSFPDRIVGYSTRSHYWDDTQANWKYNSKWTNDYSLVLTGGAIYHVYYNHLYWNQIPVALRKLVESTQNCEDILLNIIVSRLTKKPPIKLTWKKPTEGTKLTTNGYDSFAHKQKCLNDLIDIFGSVTLMKSSVRLDPILFRDPVSNLRKKYRQLEL